MADGEAGERGAAVKSWWATLPGVLTAIAGVLTAVTGLLAILAQQGVIGGAKDRPGVVTKAAGSAAAPEPAAAVAPKLPPAATAASAVSDKRLVDVSALRAEGFKGVVVTLTDGREVRINPGLREYLHGERFKLDTGQFVDFQRLRAFEVLRFSQSDGRGEVSMTLADGKTLHGNVEAYELRGRNDLGDFNAPLETVKRVDFVR